MEFDEAAVICDLAETYQIYDYRSLPVQLVATLSAGLRDNSRIKMRLSGAPCSQEVLLLAMIADRVEAFRYGFSDQKTKPPVSVVESLYGKTNADSKASFRTGEELEAFLAKFNTGE